MGTMGGVMGGNLGSEMRCPVRGWMRVSEEGEGMGGRGVLELKVAGPI